jgi:Family of unknown function (DUF5681)
MSTKDRGTGKPKRGMSSKDPEVGYGRPPVATRFRPGTSGNAKGRPKGRKNLRTLLKEAMTASIQIQEGQQTRRVSKLEGVVLRQLQGALKGNDRSAMAVIKMAHQLRFLEDAENTAAETTISPEEERVLSELARRSRKD